MPTRDRPVGVENGTARNERTDNKSKGCHVLDEYFPIERAAGGLDVGFLSEHARDRQRHQQEEGEVGVEQMSPLREPVPRLTNASTSRARRFMTAAPPNSGISQRPALRMGSTAGTPRSRALSATMYVHAATASALASTTASVRFETARTSSTSR